MRRYSCAIALILTLAAPLLVTLPTRPAHADVYAVYRIGNGNTQSVYGLTDSGVAVIKDTRCGQAGAFCYATYVNGLQTGTSTTAPLLAYDDGMACAPHLISGLTSAGRSSCNGSFNMFVALSMIGPNGIYGGPVGSPSFIFSREISADFFVNAVGDFTFSDYHTDESNWMAVDLTKVPEPSTLALLTTGYLGIAGTLRCRLQRS